MFGVKLLIFLELITLFQVRWFTANRYKFLSFADLPEDERLKKIVENAGTYIYLLTYFCAYVYGLFHIGILNGLVENNWIKLCGATFILLQGFAHQRLIHKFTSKQFYMVSSTIDHIITLTVLFILLYSKELFNV